MLTIYLDNHGHYCKMKKAKILILCIISLFASFFTFGQEVDIWNKYTDVGFAIGGSTFGANASYSMLYGFGQSKKLRVGFGVRYSLFTGSNVNYITAPANLTADEVNLDTFIVKSPQFHALNIAVFFQYQLSRKFELGFNINALGESMGC